MATAPRALLDVNVLIALLDADHASHSAAMTWFAEHAERGWASCPITQNGCVRIMSHPSYPNAHPVTGVVDRLRDATAHAAHAFWPDDISLLDATLVDARRVHGPRQLTDAYLLALAVARGGRLVTFDTNIPASAVAGARPKHLVVL
ncbi:MAG: TA system VapC family ribonuclease toxin [Gemmatimonadota bacterium]|nr:TA system VapC family ribonuclease toxin [Gemmatimonadota bacterium]